MRLEVNPAEVLHLQSIKVKERASIFKSCDVANTTLTVFIHCIELYPELLYILKDRYFLCTRRKNELDILISRSITYHYKNYDNEVISRKININLELFEKWFFQLKKLNRIQNYLVTEGRGLIVDFDELILGNAGLGFSYEVKTEDQHKNLADLVINYEEVNNKYKYLSDKYK